MAKTEKTTPENKPVIYGKNKGGRPVKKADKNLIFDLARIHCTYAEIEAITGISQSILETRYHAIIKKGDEEGKKSLRRKMHDMAMKGNVALLIWLSKQRLGYRDRQPDEAPQTIVSVQVMDKP